MALFCGSIIQSYFKKYFDAAENKIKSYDYRQLKEFDSKSIETISNYYRLNNVSVDFVNARREVTNGEDEVYNHDSEIFDCEPQYITVKGKFITVYAPISGDHSILHYSLGEQALEMFNYHDNNYEDIEIIKDYSQNLYVIKFKIFISDSELKNKSQDDAKKLVESKIDNYLQTTKLKLDRLNSFINAYNKELPFFIEKCIKTKIDDDSSLEFLSNAIGVEIHSKNPAQSEGHKIELLPKKEDLLLPDRKKYDGYYLDKNNYSAIISTIRNHISATENNPKAILKINDEELIRDTILWALNANYFVATGETFRNNGKTDILISFKDKSVFVAECKIWKGSQYFIDGINQLLGYTTWRDSKMSIIVFNLQNKDFARVCLEAKKCLTEHKLFKRMVSDKEQNYFECEYNDPNNQESTITISVLCANYSTRNE